MPTTKPRYVTTLHGKHRVKQRYGGNESQQEEIIRRALNYGVLIHQIPQRLPIYDFIDKKMRANNRNIKLLDGYVFVFFRSGRMQTMYKIPDEYLNDWEELKPIQEKNHEGYKRKKLAKHRRKHP